MGNIFSYCCHDTSLREQEQDDVDGLKYVTDKALTGNFTEQMTLIKQRVGGYINGDKKFYIGICSGHDREKAMKRRVDDYKKDNNIGKMVTLYEADSQQAVREVEEKLVEYYQRNKPGHCINRTGGGGGRPSKGPKYQVYLAIEE